MRAHRPLRLYTGGSADGPRASWAALCPASGQTVAGRVWGAQNNHRAKLCAIYAACRLASSLCPVEIHSDSRSAIQAVSALLDGQRQRTDAPAASIVRACARLIQQRPRCAPITLHWVRAHSGVPDNEAADRAAKQALDLCHIPLPEEFAHAGGFLLGGQPLDSDWLDAITDALQHQRFERLAITHQSGHFYSATSHPSFWRVHPLHERARTFAFRARGHALATTRRAHLYFESDARLPSTACPLCRERAQDDAEHWFACSALQNEWDHQLDTVQANVKPSQGTAQHWRDLMPREHLA